MTTHPVVVRFLPAGAGEPLSEVRLPSGAWLTSAVVRAAVPVVHDCDGLGLCGTCRVRVEEGAENLSPVRPLERAQLGDTLDAGWRLCCLLRVYGDVTVRVPGPGFAYRPELQRE